MLTHIHVKNFAIIDDLELDLNAGFTVLTGETGAGKSIIIDAMTLGLGDRADSQSIRHGAERAEIVLHFDISAVESVTRWLEEHDLDADGDCQVRRIVTREGRSRGYINGHPVTLQWLQALGEQLIDIHGQHAHQSLLRRGVQRQLLDDFGGHSELARQVAALYRRWRDASDELDKLRQTEADRHHRLELVQFQANELEALNLTLRELDELDEEHQRLGNADKLMATYQQALDQLYESDDALVDQLRRHTTALDHLRPYDAGLGNICDGLNGALIQLEEALVDLRHHADRLDMDPGRLQWVEQRLADITEIARKHRTEPRSLPQLLTDLQQELSQLANMEATLEQREKELAILLGHYRDAAGELSARRQTTAKRLGSQVTEIIHGLGMPGGRFQVNLQPLEADTPTPYGREKVEFVVAANPGQPLMPLGKVASGGELSRMSLAISVITAENTRIPTLIFDEVDTGVGGSVAETVGETLRTLGRHHQVLCITHLPQVAALGHQHIRVSKVTGTDTTTTHLEALDANARSDEIARMLGGIEITSQTRAHAAEMLARAQKPKRRRKEAAT